MDSNLNIVSWNCRSILSNLSLFKKFLYSSKPHIVCLCETWLKSDKEPSFINYSTIWKHRLGFQRGGGLAFLIRNDVHYSQKFINVFNINSKLEVQAIKLQIHSKLSIDILNLYNPCENISCNEYDFYFKQLDINAIITGDFNCHHRMWDMRGPNNVAGVNLVDALILNPSITLITPASLPTHYNTGTGTFSTLDLTFVSAQFCPISQIAVGKDIGSDHYPVIISVAIKPTIAKFKCRPKWKFESGSWDHRSKQLPPVDKHIVNNENINDSCLKFVTNITETSALRVKQTKEDVTPRYSKPWSTPRCAELVALKRAANRQHSRHPTMINLVAYKRTEALVKREVKVAKRTSWQKFCSEITFSTSTAVVWDKVGRLKGGFTRRTSPIITADEILTDPIRKANAIADDQ